ncbi:glycoside hydrolase, putative [Bodo saltans]|uniref:Glycoside hydrolase, putative n=1 Tax=Bodo saltans TaxID=75058 RepID=A0A0S4IMI2_BODSA|nr:glycoside hydrolase, putative [Bodo saltans]|eukprot:CUE73437.1 glycoside hydrolase, putative [Bodo saltans]
MSLYLFLVMMIVAYVATCQQQNTSSPTAIVDQAYTFLTEHLVEGSRCWDGPNGEPNQCYDFHFYRPSMTKYATAQWLWDSGSHMITWSHKNVSNSIADLRTMVQMQRRNGFIPETIFWPPQSNVTNVNNMWFYNNTEVCEISQLPVLPYSLRAIWNATHNVSLLHEFVPPLVRYLDWWFQTRRLSDSGLISILHGWESGLDASPIYDAAYNVSSNPTFEQMYPHFDDLMVSYNLYYGWDMDDILSRQAAPEIPNTLLNAWFYVEDIGVNSVFGAGWGVLAELAMLMGNQTLATFCSAREAEVLGSVLSHGWDANLHRFVSRWRAPNGTWLTTDPETVQSLMPLLFSQLPNDIATSIVTTQLLNTSKFWTNFPIPSTSADCPSFTPDETVDLMWRGPTWGFTNWLIMEGLNVHHFTQPLNDMMDRWMQLVELSGIWEMYNPNTGAAYGVEGLGMSCIVVDWMVRLGRVNVTQSVVV